MSRLQPDLMGKTRCRGFMSISIARLGADAGSGVKMKASHSDILRPEGSRDMEQPQPKLPKEAIELYNLYIHGEIERRDFLSGISKVTVAGLTAGAIIDMLMPNYALGQQVSKSDERIKASYVTIPSPQGNGSIKAYLVRPNSADTREATAAKLPGILVVHENRGLNPHIEDIARRMALANFMALAPDALTSLGGYPGDDAKGGEMFNKVDNAKKTEDFVAAAMWLKARPDCTGKIGVTGFCYGGGISNTLAVRLGADLAAAAPYLRWHRRSRRMWRRSRRRSSCTTASSTRDSLRRGRPTTRR